ncbi:MAG: PHP domain-containing protein [Elusimicrobiota bacterium]
MTKLYADLHVHTNFSDGGFSPEEAVRHAKKLGFSAISITDHDSTEGVPAALKEGKIQGVEVVPGVELSTEMKTTGESEMHILGYFINWENAQFQERLAMFRKFRQDRGKKIIDKLLKLGLKFDEIRLYEATGQGNIGRLHFAKALVEQGFVKDISGAFEKYLGFGKPAYVPKWQLRPEEAISMILKIGGIPVLAHPHYGNYANKNVLKSLVSSGLQGLEVWHSNHPQWVVQKYEETAQEFGLIATGGSDCHGQFGKQPPAMGKVKIPYEVVKKLKLLKQKIEDDNLKILKA